MWCGLHSVDIVGTMLSVGHHSSDQSGSQIRQHDIQNQSATATKCLDVVRHTKGGLPIVKLNKLPKPGASCKITVQ